MEKSISSDLIRGHIDTIILHSLLDGNKFAQQISDYIEEKSDKSYTINQATLYSSLKRLENLKFVSAYWNDSSQGRRRYFKITELGKNTVQANLSNWTYSRSIIDKLIDATPTESIRTQIIEKIVEVPVEVKVPVPVQGTEIKEVAVEKPVSVQENAVLGAKTEQENDVSVQDINFRNILNGLIESNIAQKKQEILEPIEKTEPVKTEDPDNKQNFNETINKDSLSQRKNNVNKIDFGDLVIKSNQEGYKLRISSKDEKVSKGNVPINKVRLFSSLSVFLIVLIELLLFTTTLKGKMTFSTLSIVLISISALIYPVICLIKYFINPNKTKKDVRADGILTSLIVVFNLSIITVAINLLFGTDLKNVYYLMTALVMPITLFIDVVLYFVFKYKIASILSKKKK